jgi:hypothetical protein
MSDESHKILIINHLQKHKTSIICFELLKSNLTRMKRIIKKGLSYKKILRPAGAYQRGLLRCYQYLAPLVQFPNSTRGAKYW